MTKRALLIGINDYEHVSPLSGCLNDVELLAGVLTDAHGFAAEHVTRLVDPDTRRADILAGFDALVGATEPGDVVLLAYSGHGSQTRDVDRDEPDRMDETIVPRDSGRGAAPNRDITDDEINSVVQALTARGADLTVVFDSCHSGSATRRDLLSGPPGTTTRWVTPDRRAPGEPAHLQPGTQPLDRLDTAGGWVPPGAHVFVSGCQADELSNEYPVDGRQQGALTYHLCRRLAGGAAGLTWQEVVDAAGAAVSADFPKQHPQLEAPDDRRTAPPFGG